MTMPQAFNEWMRRYIEFPDQFANDWQLIREFLAQSSRGKEPTYGEMCSAYLKKLIQETA